MSMCDGASEIRHFELLEENAYDETDEILALAYMEEEKIEDHIAEEECLEEELREAYSEMDEEVRRILKTEPGVDVKC